MIYSDSMRVLVQADHAHAAQRVAKLEADLETLTKARQSESDDDEHDPEGETLSAQWSMRAGLLASAREMLQLSQAALTRLEDGSYGICAVCLQPIPEAQLEVRSFREECVQCANKLNVRR